MPVQSPSRITLVEVSPRDGLQNERAALSTEAKLALIARAVDAGARRIEAVSFVDPRRVPRMADADAVMAGVERRPDVAYAGLVLNPRGLDRALAARVDEVDYVVVASETFSQRNQGQTTAQSLDFAAVAGRACAAAGVGFTATIAAAFGCPFEGEVAPAHVAGIARRLAQSGASEIALADTIGVAVPDQVERLVKMVAEAAPGVNLRLHLHDTRHTAVANAFAAWRAGVAVFDASIGGIGGCPFAPDATGNVATEDLAWMFERMGVDTGLSVPMLVAAAHWLEPLLGHPLAGAVSRAGAFPPTTERS